MSIVAILFGANVDEYFQEKGKLNKERETQLKDLDKQALPLLNKALTDMPESTKEFLGFFQGQPAIVNAAVAAVKDNDVFRGCSIKAAATNAQYQAQRKELLEAKLPKNGSFATRIIRYVEKNALQ